MNTITKPKILELPKNKESRGYLTYIEKDLHIPFKIERAVWRYDLPMEEMPVGYACKNSEQLIIPLTGSLEVLVTDGKNTSTFFLNKAFKGLYIPPEYWVEIKNFSSNSMILILGSEKYNEEEYVYEHYEFLKLKNHE